MKHKLFEDEIVVSISTSGKAFTLKYLFKANFKICKTTIFKDKLPFTIINLV